MVAFSVKFGKNDLTKHVVLGHTLVREHHSSSFVIAWELWIDNDGNQLIYIVLYNFISQANINTRAPYLKKNRAYIFDFQECCTPAA